MTTYFAGDVLDATDLNTEVGLTDITTDSTASSGTTETAALFSVTGNVVSGETYWVELWCNVSCDNVATPQLVLVRIREDSGTGTQVQVGQMWILNTTSIGLPIFVRGKYTAASTGSKTFSVTLQRSAGSANAYQIRAGTGRNGSFRIVHRTAA